jgi:cytochrome P450
VRTNLTPDTSTEGNQHGKLHTGAEKDLRRAPGPSHNLVFEGRAGFFRTSFIDYLIDSFVEYGDVVNYRLLHLQLYLLAAPRDVEHVLHTNHQNYVKASPTYGILKKLVGEGLLTSEGPLWVRQRRLIQSGFRHEHLTEAATVVTTATLEMIERWKITSAQGRSFNLLHELARLTLKIFGSAFLGVDISHDATAIGRDWAVVSEYFGQWNLNRFLPFVPTVLAFKWRVAARSLRRLADKVISERRKSATGKHDLLSILLDARDGWVGNDNDYDRQLRDEIITLILAGHETTAAALTWTYGLLARNPESERKLSIELASVLGGRTPAITDLSTLKYTRTIVEESMRLYPPVWFIPRSPIEDDEIAGYRIPKGSIVMLSPYVTHRHPFFWDEPERFRPERFSAENFQSRPRFAYFPFGGGPRQCVGSGFAMMEAQLILATIGQHYRLEVASNSSLEARALVTLRPRDGLRFIAQPVENPGRQSFR